MRTLKRTLASSVAALALSAAAPALAAGLARPNIAGGRPVGLGGAYVAVAEDPSAIWYNPAGLAQSARMQLLAGVELAKPTFRYDPAPGQCLDATNTPSATCARVESASSFTPIPVIGYATRFASRGGEEPSRLALGFLFHNSYGGAIEYDENKLKAQGARGGVLKSQLALLEAAPSVAYRVNEDFYVGAAFRMGYGMFNVTNAAKGSRTDAVIDSTGLGVGYSLGVMLRPVKMLRLGVAYRSQLAVEPSGDGKIISRQGADASNIQNCTPPDCIASPVKTRIPWPQQVSGGLSLNPVPGLLVTTQVDWVNWSAFQEIAPDFSADRALGTLARYYTTFKDSWSAHAGLEYAVGDVAAVRAGYTRDSNAIPDFSIDRQYVDGPKNTVGGGGSLTLAGQHRIDLAAEYLFGSERVVADNTMTAPPELRNAAPGKLAGTVFTLQLSYLFSY